MKTVFYELNSKGWAEINNVKSDSDIMAISKSIGKVIPHPNGQDIFTVVPKLGNNSTKGTLSNIYGYGEFPLHTDTAFWPKPARYLLLFSSQTSYCCTTIVSAYSILDTLTQNQLEYARRAIFKVQTIHSQFYTSLLFKHDNNWGMKYDLTCMKPINDYAKKIVECMSNVKLVVEKMEWKGNNAILIDNWRALHGRSAADVNEKRELKRIYII